jgi:hypothetical protein
LLLAMLLHGAPIWGEPAEPDRARLEKQRCPKPTEFASIFSFGYASDLMPPEDDRFEDLLKKLKDGGFNVVHCTYTEKRLALCKKHGMRMMVDLLADVHHVYKTPDKAEAVCRKLRDNADVWGYNIWNDPFGKASEGRRRDINNVREWDPTHPAFCGTYRTAGMSHLVNADVIGYYDFHWKRGLDQHFSHLLAYSGWARERDAWFCAWLSVTSGQAGKGNFNRCLWSANTSIACGLKGALWFLGTDMMDRKTQEWTDAGRDIIRVNKEIMPLRRELARIGNPSAIYSTAVTKTANDTALPGDRKEAMPPGLDKNAFPKDFWIQPTAGEFLMGVFRIDGKRDAVFVANHNAYAGQKVGLLMAERIKTCELFDRKSGRWHSLEIKGGAIAFDLPPGGGELLHFGE